MVARYASLAFTAMTLFLAATTAEARQGCLVVKSEIDDDVRRWTKAVAAVAVARDDVARAGRLIAERSQIVDEIAEAPTDRAYEVARSAGGLNIWPRLHKGALDELQAATMRFERAIIRVVGLQSALDAKMRLYNALCAAAAGASGKDRDRKVAATTDAVPDISAFSGYWGTSTGKFYLAKGDTLYRYGKPVVTIACRGQAKSKSGENGTACAGQWFNSSGASAGAYRGVLYRSEQYGLVLEGAYTYTSSPDKWWGWTFTQLTDKKARELGLTSGKKEAR